MRCVRALLAVALPLVAVGMQLPTAKLSEFFEHARAEVAHASSCADACAALSVDSKRLSDLRYAFCVQFSSLHVTQYCSVAMSQALVRDGERWRERSRPSLGPLGVPCTPAGV